MKKVFLLGASLFFVCSSIYKSAVADSESNFGLEVIIRRPKLDQTSKATTFPLNAESRGVCYRRRGLTEGLCSAPLIDFLVSIEDCCSSVGAGWDRSRGQPGESGGWRCSPCSSLLPENVCEKGFKRDQVSDTCRDVDECSFKEICPNGMCVNTVGSYFCECNPDYSIDTTRTVCVSPLKSSCYLGYNEFNRECSMEIGAQMNRMQCCCTFGRAWGRDSCEYCPSYSASMVNAVEYFKLCPFGPGYTVELAASNKILCNNTSCGPGGRCRRSFEGSVQTAECICFGGFERVLDPTRTKVIYCKDYNECELIPFLCPNGKCVNQLGNYSCLCYRGYRLNGLNCVRAPPQIIAVEKCREDQNPCGAGGLCYDVEESYGCICFEGYELVDRGINKINCIDIDECSGEINPCGPQVECINTEGCFECQCGEHQRYVPIISSCVDVERGNCYISDTESDSFGSIVVFDKTRRECCCSNNSIERGIAWGEPCNVIQCSDQEGGNFEESFGLNFCKTI